MLKPNLVYNDDPINAIEYWNETKLNHEKTVINLIGKNHKSRLKKHLL